MLTSAEFDPDDPYINSRKVSHARETDLEYEDFKAQVRQSTPLAQSSWLSGQHFALSPPLAYSGYDSQRPAMRNSESRLRNGRESCRNGAPQETWHSSSDGFQDYPADSSSTVSAGDTRKHGTGGTKIDTALVRPLQQSDSVLLTLTADMVVSQSGLEEVSREIATDMRNLLCMSQSATDGIRLIVQNRMFSLLSPTSTRKRTSDVASLNDLDQHRVKRITCGSCSKIMERPCDLKYAHILDPNNDEC